MNATAYYRHARKLGSFRAIDAWKLAKEAASLDAKSYVSTPPAAVSREVLHDGSNPVHLSFGVFVF